MRISAAMQRLLAIAIVFAVGIGYYLSFGSNWGSNSNSRFGADDGSVSIDQVSSDHLGSEGDIDDDTDLVGVDPTDKEAPHQDRFGPDSLIFPNGESVPVRWTRLPVPSNKPEPPYVDSYEQLVRNAEAGDPESAFALWSLLDQCREYAYETADQLDSALRQLRETQYYQTPEMLEPKWAGSAESAQTLELVLSIEYENCKGLTSEHKARASEFLKIASDAGYPIAMLEYSAYVTDLEEGIELDTERWNAGDAQGLNDLAKRLESTYYSGEQPTNKIPAYSALLAFTIIADRQFSMDGIYQDPRYEFVHERMSKIKADLLPHEFEVAVANAVKMVRENPNCCFGF